MLSYLEASDRFVLSTTLRDPEWRGTQILAGGLDQIEALRHTPGGDILVCGSPTVVRGLLARGLLDELNVTLLPIVVGAGARPFPESVEAGLQRLPLTLVSARSLSSGAVGRPVAS